MTRHGRTRVYVASGALAVACQSNDVPENEPTLVTVTSDDGDGGGGGEHEGAGDAVDETAGGAEPPPQCWPDHQPTNPTLFQCSGLGGGDLQWEQFVLSWSAASLDEPVTIEFPPHAREDPNVQACCEAQADEAAVGLGCLQDCAHAACNLAIDRLRAKLDAAAPCGGECKERFVDTLTTWVDFLEANYAMCLQVARGEATGLNLPDPPSASDPIPTGAGRLAVLTLECAVDEQDVPHDTEQTCETGLNEPAAGAWEEWSCPALFGDVEIDGPQGTDWLPLTGRVTLRRGLCAPEEPCWFSLESLALVATGSSQRGYSSDAMSASLAYPGFGRYDVATHDATIATSMLGLDVAPSEAPYSFPIANSDPALFELGAGTFEIVDATFAWDEHAVTLTTELARCTCTSCA